MEKVNSIVDTCSLGNRQFIVVAQYESEGHLLAVGAAGFLTSLNCREKNTIEKDSKKILRLNLI